MGGGAIHVRFLVTRWTSPPIPRSGRPAPSSRAWGRRSLDLRMLAELIARGWLAAGCVSAQSRKAGIGTVTDGMLAAFGAWWRCWMNPKRFRYSRH